MVNSSTNGRLFQFSYFTRLEGFPSHPTLHYRSLSNTGESASFNASISLSSKKINCIALCSRLSDSPPGVRNRQEKEGLIKQGSGIHPQDSFDLVPFYYKVKSQCETQILPTSAEASSWLRKDPLEIPSDS